MTTDIPICYINATTHTDFQVVVFTKNFTVNMPLVYYVAWEILKTQSQIDFKYPVSMSVGATFESGDQTNIAGPFEAKLGSTWEITQPRIDSIVTLKESKS